MSDVPRQMDGALPGSIEEYRLELREWALTRLQYFKDADAEAEGDEVPYAFFGTDWFGVIQKCFWQTEELLERIVNLFVATRSVSQQPNISRMVKGKGPVQLTLSQCISVLGQIDFTTSDELRAKWGEGYDLFLGRLEAELAILRELGKERNQFTHDPLSLEAEGRLCSHALATCAAFCEFHLVRLAALVEEKQAKRDAATDGGGM